MMAIKQKLNEFLKPGIRKKLILFIVVSLFAVSLLVSRLHSLYFGPNVVKSYLLYIREGDNFEKVFSQLRDNGCLTKMTPFRHLARVYDYDTNVRTGAYRLQPGWSSHTLVNMLRSGTQTPVLVTFNNVRTREELAGKLSKQLQGDSATFISLLRNDSIALKLGFNAQTFPALFIPNTYSFYWTTSPAGFLNRMKREYDQFWNEGRRLKAKALGLTTAEVATLASIVQEESNKNDEKPAIAGVYLNRIREKIPLQADPTIRFALGDYTIRRVLTVHLSIESPYNTYLHAGLPPGPINFPEIPSLDAVLNTQKHNYFYFCAKEDFSGYHNFARTLDEHNNNARKYQAALNKMKIFK
jgi:UPF0755 protein